MKIVKETPVEYVKIDVDFEDTEYQTLLDYGKAKIPSKVLDDLILEWAFIDALEQGLKLKKKTKKKNTRKKVKK